MFKINDKCLYLKKILELLPHLKSTSSEDDIPEQIQGLTTRDYFQRQAYRRHNNTNYDEILDSDELFDDETKMPLDMVCFERGICPPHDFLNGEQCPSKEHGYNIVKDKANELSKG